MRDFGVHKADEPIRRQKENRGENNEQETAVEKHQTERNQKARREHHCADAPLLCARVEACVGRLETRKQQSQRNEIEHEQHDIAMRRPDNLDRTHPFRNIHLV